MSTGYRYTVTLVPYGGVGSAGMSDKAKCEFELGAEVKRYMDIGREIKATEFVSYCADCGGESRIIICKSKKPSWQHAHKPSCYRRCPTCKGKNSEVILTALPCGSYTGINAQTKELSDMGNVAEYSA